MLMLMVYGEVDDDAGDDTDGDPDLGWSTVWEASMRAAQRENKRRKGGGGGGGV